MKWIQVQALAGSVSLVLGASAPLAQTDTARGSQATAASDNMSAKSGGASDKMFVKKAMEGGMAEVRLGQLATEKASSEDVKQFGQKMVDDHSKMNDQMKPIASNLGVQQPSDLAPQDKALESRLSGLSGAAFDKAYMSAMVKDHHKDLMEFKKEASSGKDPQVKSAADQGSQVIEQHLQMAEQIAHKVGAGGGNMAK